MRMSYRLSAGLLGLLLAIPTRGNAAPILSVDLDTTMAGIQNTRTVTAGTTFTVAVVIADSGAAPTPTMFDTALLALSYNDGGAVLSAAATPLAGNLAMAGTTLDAVNASGVSPGSSLATTAAAPAAGFASVTGAAGVADLFTVNPGPAQTILTIDFTALAAGTSAFFIAGLDPVNDPPVANAGAPLQGLLRQGAEVTVQPGTVVPEPGSAALLITALAGLLGGSCRRRGAGRKA